MVHLGVGGATWSPTSKFLGRAQNRKFQYKRGKLANTGRRTFMERCASLGKRLQKKKQAKKKPISFSSIRTQAVRYSCSQCENACADE